VITTTAVVGSDSIASFALAVKQSKLFTTLPSCFDDIDIPGSTLPSKLHILTCYKNVISYYKTHGMSSHPSKTLENMLFEQDVSYTPVKVVTQLKEEYEVVKGFTVKKGDPNQILSVACGFTATALAFFPKLDDTGRLMELPKAKDLESLKWVYPDLGALRLSTGNTTKSPTMAQSEIYNSLKSSPLVAVHLMSAILDKVPQFSDIDKRLAIPLNKFYDKNGIDKKDRMVPRSPVAIKLPIVNEKKNAVDNAWKYLDKSRQIRGEDAAGIGSLTMGYYFGDHPRSIIKYLSLIYDVRALMMQFEVTNVIVHKGFPDYVKRSLVLSGYWVISKGDLTLPRYDSTVPGIYNDIDKNVSALEVRDLICERPKVLKGVVMYPIIDLSTIESSMVSSGTEFAVRFVVAKLPIMRLFSNEKKLAFFPSSQPHNAYIWVGGFASTGSYDISLLALRTLNANIYRNHYPINKVAFFSRDPMCKHFAFDKGICLARMSTAKVKRNDLSFDFVDDVSDNKDIVLDPIASITVDLSAFEKQIHTDTLTSGTLTDIMDNIKELCGNDKVQLKNFILYQKYREDDGCKVNHFMSKLLAAYSWSDIYGFYELGKFDYDYKVYVEGKEDDAPGLELPMASSIVIPNGEEDDQDQDNKGEDDDDGSSALAGITYEVDVPIVK